MGLFYLFFFNTHTISSSLAILNRNKEHPSDCYLPSFFFFTVFFPPTKSTASSAFPSPPHSIDRPRGGRVRDVDQHRVRVTGGVFFFFLENKKKLLFFVWGGGGVCSSSSGAPSASIPLRTCVCVCFHGKKTYRKKNVFTKFKKKEKKKKTHPGGPHTNARAWKKMAAPKTQTNDTAS